MAAPIPYRSASTIAEIRSLKAVRWAERESTFFGKPVVLVPCDHEFYATKRTRMIVQLREAAAGSNVHLLDRDEVVLDGVRFLGTTLRTDFKLDVARGTDVMQAVHNAWRGLNDLAGQIRERGVDPLGAASVHAARRGA